MPRLTRAIGSERALPDVPVPRTAARGRDFVARARARIPRVWLLALFTLSLSSPARADAERPEVKAPEVSLLRQVAFGQNLNAQLPLDTLLRDESGRKVPLGQYFGKKPVVLLFVYYECPMLCTLELNGLVRNLRALSMTAGKEFDIVTISIDPTETPALARAKKTGYLKKYGRPEAEGGWHFLTGPAEPVRRLADTVGFRYAYDPKSKQYAHPAGLVVATPEGRLARYIYGVDFPANTLRWSLIDASAGRIGTPVDRVLLMCFHYDPSTGRYNFAVMFVVRFLGICTLIGLAVFVTANFLRDRRRAAAVATTV
jgi:protein SCO1/2